jgi:hypothetical protein
VGEHERRGVGGAGHEQVHGLRMARRLLSGKPAARLGR